MNSHLLHVKNPICKDRIAYGSKSHHSLIVRGIVDHYGELLPQKKKVTTIENVQMESIQVYLPMELFLLIFLPSYECYSIFMRVSQRIREILLQNRTKWIEWVIQRRMEDYMVASFPSETYLGCYRYFERVCNKRTGHVYRQYKDNWSTTYKLNLALAHLAEFSS